MSFKLYLLSYVFILNRKEKLEIKGQKGGDKCEVARSALVENSFKMREIVGKLISLLVTFL